MGCLQAIKFSPLFIRICKQNSKLQQANSEGSVNDSLNFGGIPSMFDLAAYGHLPSYSV